VATQKSMVTNSTEISHHEKLKHCTQIWAEVHYALCCQTTPYFFFLHPAPVSCYQHFSALCPVVFWTAQNRKRKNNKIMHKIFEKINKCTWMYECNFITY
jgi:hypothetical protein